MAKDGMELQKATLRKETIDLLEENENRRLFLYTLLKVYKKLLFNSFLPISTSYTFIFC